jgi:hypothetical protein
MALRTPPWPTFDMPTLKVGRCMDNFSYFSRAPLHAFEAAIFGLGGIHSLVGHLPGAWSSVGRRLTR